MTWTAYLDESQRTNYYFVAAAFGPDDEWNLFNSRVSTLRQQLVSTYNLPHTLEFHGHPLMGGKGEWKMLRGKHREAGDIYLQFLECFKGLEQIRFTFRGVNVARLNARYKYPENPHVLCTIHTLERVNEYMGIHGISGCKVVADESSEEAQVTRQVSSNQRFGGRGYRGSHLSHIVPPVVGNRPVGVSKNLVFAWYGAGKSGFVSFLG